VRKENNKPTQDQKRKDAINSLQTHYLYVWSYWDLHTSQHRAVGVCVMSHWTKLPIHKHRKTTWDRTPALDDPCRGRKALFHGR
jgi:hypothetical protein